MKLLTIVDRISAICEDLAHRPGESADRTLCRTSFRVSIRPDGTERFEARHGGMISDMQDLDDLAADIYRFQF